jgi:CRISPR system Cascade subunit CasC
LATKLAEEGRAPTEDELKLLREKHKAADIALFGRMLADSPKYNVEAACQVAHAVTVHRAAVEDDFFTAVDDLNTREEDAGSAHMGEQGFGAGLFYVYLCIDCDLLKANLNGDTELAGKAIRALIDAVTKVAPTGKQNSFASRAWAYYGLAEKGSRQPRSLSLAFMKPVREGDMLTDAAKALETMRGNLDKVYYEGKAESSKCFNAVTGEGSFRELLNWAVGGEEA